MKEIILGIDTSCYTTSVALMDEDGTPIWEQRKILEVPSGKRGLSQSEMIFQHTEALPRLIEEAFSKNDIRIGAIGVSSLPRRQEGSYMPAFLSGTGYARSLAAALKVPLFLFSHQEGHIWASLQEELFAAKLPCFALQSSGGTLEALQINWTDSGELDIQVLYETADISIGQLIDRMGIRMGLPFPAGPHYPVFDRLKLKGKSLPVSIREGQIFLAGAESHLIREEAPTEEILRETLYIAAETLRRLCKLLGNENDSIIMVGGVLANESIRGYLNNRVQTKKLYFPEPKYNSDNAMGIARAALESWRQMKSSGK